jgi:PAS domain S-box-containing protein
VTTVLIVDDRAVNREIARATLHDGGYDVIEATEGHQALAVAKANHPDVVLTDVLMPGMDGYEFAHELRCDPDTADIPVLFYTANYSEDEALPLAATLRVSKVLSKSGDPFELLQAVDHALHDRPDPVVAPGADFAAQHVTTVNAKLLENVQALDQSEARFAAMAQASPIGIVIGDAKGRATYVNPRLSEITHTPGADLLGLGWQRCLTAEHRDSLYAAGPDHDLNLGPGEVRHRARITLLDGQSCWMNVLIRAVHGHDGAATGLVAMIDDVTSVVDADERRRAAELEREREARRQIAARFDSLARLAGGVAHDFNNMLNVILSFGEFIKESVTDARGAVLTDEQTQAILTDVDQVQRAGQRAADLTHQLLAFGGREVVSPVPVDVNALLNEVRDMIAGTVGQFISITTDLDPEVSRVLADAGQLTQILINLAVNAHDAMADGGQLHLSTADTDPETDRHVAGLAPGEYVHIAVTDTGHGMPSEVVRQAMEPFFTTKPRGQGSGLGLATSYGVVKQAGGDLIIESAPGRGTTVHIYLPATDRQPEITETTVAAPTSTAQTVLVAEDEDALRDAVTRFLTRAGYHVLAAPNGLDALTIADRHHDVIHALLTDVVMPLMNGPELAKALRQVRPGIPVLYMSGFAAPLMTEQGLLEPGVTVLGKPFTRPELLNALSVLTGQSHHPAGAIAGEVAERPAPR